jgi:hypothetical protein
MTQEIKDEITNISKEFASGFKDTIGEISGSGWLIVDPLSGYLNACGYENKLGEIPANNKHPQILIMTFTDGSKFIPAGGDLRPIHPEAKDWMWLSF